MFAVKWDSKKTRSTGYTGNEFDTKEEAYAKAAELSRTEPGFYYYVEEANVDIPHRGSDLHLDLHAANTAGTV